MHFSTNTLLLASFTAVTLVTAAPTATSEDKHLQRRACTTMYPTLVAKVNEKFPDQADEGQALSFDVAYEPDVTGEGEGTRRDSILQFGEMAQGSYGCQLEAFFPVGAFNSQYGNTKVGVYGVDVDDGVLGQGMSWNTAPPSRYWFGTVDLLRRPNDVVKAVVNSFECRSNLAFRVTTYGDVEGAVVFPNGPTQGFRVTHNC